MDQRTPHLRLPASRVGLLLGLITIILVSTFLASMFTPMGTHSAAAQAEPTQMPSQNQGELDFVLSSGFPVSVAVTGDRAYLGIGSKVVAIDVTDRTRPLLMGQSVPLADKIWDIAIQGGYAYVVTDQNDLHIFSIDNPRNIEEVGNLDYPDTSINGGVVVVGSYAYVVHGYLGLSIIDVSDPKFPREVSSYNEAASQLYMYDVEVVGNIVYVATNLGFFALEAAEAMWIYKLSSYAINTSNNVAIAGNYAYLDEYAGGAPPLILNISNLSSPRKDSVMLDHRLNSPVTAIQADANYAYLTSCSRLYVVGVHDSLDIIGNK